MLNSLDVADLHYKYLVLDNASIHKGMEVQEWVKGRGYQVLFLPPYSPFLNPIEEFWSKSKAVVDKDPLSIRKNSKLSDRIEVAYQKITREDCQAWIRHSLTFWPRCIAKEDKL